MKKLVSKLRCIIRTGMTAQPRAFDAAWFANRPGVKVLLRRLRGRDAAKLQARMDPAPRTAKPPARATGYLEGFDQAGNIYGWLDRTTRHAEEFSVVCGDERLPVHPKIWRQDLADAGFPSGRGFIVEFRKVLPLLRPFFSGCALRVEGISSSLLGQPLEWTVLQPGRRNELLWNWLARFFALSLESSTFDLAALELFDAEFSKLEQEGLAGLQDETGAMRCVQLMQDLCGQQVGGQAEFRSNLDKLCQLSSQLARSHSLWTNLVAGFQAAMVAEDFLDTVRRVWRQQALLEVEDEKPITPRAPFQELFLATVLHPGRLHFVPWEGWVLNSLLSTIELAANLPAERSVNEDLAAKLSEVEAIVSLVYRDEEITGRLQRLRRQLGIYSGQPSAHARREVLALKKQRKFLQALSIESQIPSEESISSAVNAFASQLGAARELRQTLPAAVIRAWKGRLGPGVEQAATNPVFLAALHDYLEFAGRVLMNPATTAGQPIGQAQRMRLDIIGSIKELLSLEPIRPLARGSKTAGEPLNILLVGSRDLPQVHLYRQEQKVAALRNLSTRTRPINIERADTWEKINDPKLTRCLVGCDILVVCRLPASLSVLRLIHAARRAGVKVIYEIDDLIFDHENFPPAYETYSGSITRREHRQLAEDTPLWLEAMRLADEIIVSTTTLAERVRALLGMGQIVHIEPNCQPQLLRDCGLPERRQKDAIHLVYGTGTKAHKQIIEEWILPVLQTLLEKHPLLAVTLVGRIKGLPQTLAAHPRVTISPFVDYESYLHTLATADVSLAAIESSPATDAKSELKWMEAAVLGAASVVSPSATYREVLQDGVDVLFAATKEEWETQLGRLIGDAGLRARIAANARHVAMTHFSPSTPRDVWGKILEAQPDIAVQDARPLKLLVVNLYFAPQASGGATRVVEDQIRDLQNKYSGRYEITVLCSDRFGHDGGVEIHHQPGVRVVRLKAPSRSWDVFQDDDIKRFVQDWLSKERFDLVHAHALQVLTASVLEAADIAGIPYIVSLHDAWWLSQHQFLTSPGGKAIDPTDWMEETGYKASAAQPAIESHRHRARLESILGPLHQNAQAQSEASRKGDFSGLKRLQLKRRGLDRQLEGLIPKTTTRTNVYAAYVRRHDLLRILRRAAARLAVSSSFARIYSEADVTKVGILHNRWQVYHPTRERITDNVLECAFIGGWSLHKGAGVLLEACRLIQNAGPIHLRIVDHSLSNQEYHDVRWGEVDVRFIAPLPLAEMQEFYQSIEVLIAPSIWPESFGLVTREALSAGVWVIAAESGALAEPVQDGFNGNVVPPRDAGALAKAILHLASAGGRKELRKWQERTLAGKGLASPPENGETLHRIYAMAAAAS